MPDPDVTPLPPSSDAAPQTVADTLGTNPGNAVPVVSDLTLTNPPLDRPGFPSSTPVPNRDFAVGSRVRHVGDYEILGELGRGGMGVVYKARHAKLGRLVALKMIRSASHASAAEVARFLAEARAEARLDHASIIPVFEIGEADGLPFFAMALVEGGSLSQRLADGPLPPKVSARVMRQVADAIQHAHDRGVLHRDLKPQNILLQQDNETADSGSNSGGAGTGTVRPASATAGTSTRGESIPIPKVSDFGLSRLIGQDGLTATGEVLGTPSYMPPEQASGHTREVGPHSDVYSLGAVLYSLLTGRPPFQAATLTETLRQVREQEPAPPSRLNSAVPRDLETVCLKCLEKEPARRYTSAAALAEDLRRFAAGEPILAVPASVSTRVAKWVRRRPLIAGLLATVVVVTAIGIASFAWAYQQALHETNHARQEASRADDEARRANELLTRAEEANRLRIRARVEQLRTASPQVVSGLLKDLQGERVEARPYLSESWDASVAKSEMAGRMRLALALLPERPALRDEVARWMLTTDDPREMLLTRDALAPYAADLTNDLWSRATDNKASSAERFQALVALAAFDPGNSRWREGGETAVEQLLKANPLFLGVWTQALQPVSGALTQPLSAIYRSGSRDEQRLIATNILAEYGRDNPTLLADLIADSRTDQFVALLPALERHRKKAVEILSHELTDSTTPVWHDKPLEPARSALPPETVRELENAGGMVTRQFALYQNLPADRSSPINTSLKLAGYRPINYRPYSSNDKVYLAAVWTRDGLDYRLAEGVTVDAVRRADDTYRPQGFVPRDIARFQHDGKSLCTILWIQKTPDVVETRLYVDVPPENHDATWQPLQKAGYTPVTQYEVDLSGDRRHDGIWWKLAKSHTGDNYNFRFNESDYEDNFTIGGTQTDVRLLRAPIPPSLHHLEDSRTLLNESEQALAKNSKNDNARWQTALALMGLGRWNEALLYLDALIAKYPNVGPAFQQRALARASLGDKDGAREDATRVSQLSVSVNERTTLDIRVHVLAGDDQNAMRLSDVASAANGDDPAFLYSLAKAAGFAASEANRRDWRLSGSAAGSGILASRLHWREKKADLPSPAYADRAITLLQASVAAGFRDFARIAVDEDFAFVRVHPDFMAILDRGHLDREYSAIWHNDPMMESTEIHGLDPLVHRERFQQLVSEGWRPISLTVAETRRDEPSRTASVWQRPAASTRERTARARRGANAATAILRLEPTEDARALLRQTPNPDRRSYLIRELAPCGVEARTVLQRLNEADDVSVRRALILALGEYSEEQLTTEARTSITSKLLRWYRQDPDAGVHGAINWLLRHGREGNTPRNMDWRQSASLASIDTELAGKVPAKGQTWTVAKSGFTMTVIPGPTDFWMGSLPGEPNRAEDETRHRRRIVHGFAIATTDVTVAQYKVFLRANPPNVLPNYVEGTSPEDDCPINGVDWYTAAKYCRWLSEKEGIPEAEMCYPEMKEIKEGMRLPADLPSRHGYRLPTEAEWEFACRAGSETTRFYGAETDLLPRYGWFIQNGNDRTWPVGQKRPNDLGMVDMHGGVWNWCQDRYRSYGGGGYRTDDDPDLGKAIKDNESRILRGGTFDSQPHAVRCAYRNANRPSLRILNVGFRVARTFPAPTP
jgi:serine/threonine protein kinase/formylglycine-generating enzyme required for sulfatase activity